MISAMDDEDDGSPTTINICPGSVMISAMDDEDDASTTTITICPGSVMISAMDDEDDSTTTSQMPASSMASVAPRSFVPKRQAGRNVAGRGVRQPRGMGGRTGKRTGNFGNARDLNARDINAYFRLYKNYTCIFIKNIIMI
jgi:hypothetical protein